MFEMCHAAGVGSTWLSTWVTWLSTCTRGQLHSSGHKPATRPLAAVQAGNSDLGGAFMELAVLFNELIDVSSAVHAASPPSMQHPVVLCNPPVQPAYAC